MVNGTFSISRKQTGLNPGNTQDNLLNSVKQKTRQDALKKRKSLEANGTDLGCLAER